MTDADLLFDLPPQDVEDRRTMQDLRALHDRGCELLERYVPDGKRAIYRVRDASGDGWHDADRRHQVTVRYKTASGATAREWENILLGDVDCLVYGWLDGDDVKQVVVLDTGYLLEDTQDRPGCLIPPDNKPRATNRTAMTHHAPGGAEFLVIDVRRLTLRCALMVVGPVAVGSHTADLAYQAGLFE